ncbi:MAG: tetratricopeptide repeat protein [Planctomycetes bacterium]|nr:tetratricopeptide repeat protein [Planctomycetota bacterium]
MIDTIELDPAEIIDELELRLDLGRHKDCLDLANSLDAAALSDEQKVRATLIRAISHGALRMDKEAQKEFRSIYTHAAEFPIINYKAGLFLISAGKHSDGIDRLMRVIENDNTDTSLFIHACSAIELASFLLGRKRLCLFANAKVAESGLISPKILTTTATRLMMDGDVEQAKSFLVHSIQMDHTEIEAYIRFAQILIEENHYSEAEEILRAAADVSPQCIELHLLWGDLFRLASNQQAAIHCYKKVYELAPAGALTDGALYSIAAIYFKLRSIDLAKSYLQKLIEGIPDSPLTKSSRQILKSLSKPRASMQPSFEIEGFPHRHSGGTLPANISSVLAYWGIVEKDDACDELPIIENWLDLKSSLSEFPIAMRIFQGSINNLFLLIKNNIPIIVDISENHYPRFITIVGSDHARELFIYRDDRDLFRKEIPFSLFKTIWTRNLCISLVCVPKQLAGMLSDLKAEDSENVLLWLDALSDFENKRMEQAEVKVDELVDSWPDFEFGYTLKARVLIERGGIDEAIALLSGAESKFRQSTERLKLLGDAYFINQDLEPAYNSYKRALKISKHDNALLRILGETSMKLGRYKEARTYFKQCLDIDQFDGLAHLLLAESIAPAKRIKEAGNHYLISAQLSVNPEYAIQRYFELYPELPYWWDTPEVKVPKGGSGNAFADNPRDEDV